MGWLSMGEVVLGGARVKQSRVPSCKGIAIRGKAKVELSNEESRYGILTLGAGEVR